MIDVDNYSKRILNAIDEISVSHLALSAIASLVFFALLYLIGSRYGWGLRSDTETVIGFGSCLYFSVVTFTSLGFGDLVPVGAGRLLAGLEVFAGLTFFGIAVAKLSSYKQSYLLNQLYARDIQGKLDLFAENLRAHRSACKQLSGVLIRNGKSVQSIGKLLEETKTEMTRIRAFVSFESRNGYLVSSTPTGSMTRLLKAISSLMPRLVQVTSIRQSQSSQKHRSNAKEIVKLAAAISAHFAETKNESVISEAKTLTNRCKAANNELQACIIAVDAKIREIEDRKKKERSIVNSSSARVDSDTDLALNPEMPSTE